MKRYGICTEIISVVVGEMRMKAEYIFYSWERGERMTGRGKVFDTFLSYAATEERRKNLDYCFVKAKN